MKRSSTPFGGTSALSSNLVMQKKTKFGNSHSSSSSSSSSSNNSSLSKSVGGYSSGATIGNATREGSYIPLIECINDRYEVKEEAITFLKAIPGPIAVISVVGKYRTGKSYLINQGLLNAPPGEGFSVGDTTRACTKGLLLSTKVLKIKYNNTPLRALVIDTEGIGSLCANANHDSRVFALAMLLSSYLVYNSMGPIDEGALENLSLVTNLTKEIRLSKSSSSVSASSSSSSSSSTLDSSNVSNNTSSTSSSSSGPFEAVHSSEPAEYSIRNDAEMRKYFPSLLWVLRDFSLKMVDENTGEVISSDQYLEQSLKTHISSSSSSASNNSLSRGDGGHSGDYNTDGSGSSAHNNVDPGSTDIERHKNRIRRTLRTYFPDRTCVQLPRPSNDENVDMSDRSKLRPAFLEGITRFQKTIVNAVKPKLIGGKPISGSIFAKLCQTFVSAINNNTVPVVRDVWDMLSKDRCMEAYQEAVSNWDQEEKTIRDGLESGTQLMNANQLKKQMHTIGLAIKKEFDNKAVGDHAPEYQQKLIYYLEEKQKSLLLLNQREVKHYLSRQVLQKLNQHLINGEDLEKIYAVYQTECESFIKRSSSSSSSLSSSSATLAPSSSSSSLPSSFNSTSLNSEDEKIRQEWMIAFHDWVWETALVQYRRVQGQLSTVEQTLETKVEAKLKELGLKSKEEVDAIRGQLQQVSAELESVQQQRIELQESGRKDKNDWLDAKQSLEIQLDQRQTKISLLEREQIEERKLATQQAETLQQQATELQEQVTQLQLETKRLGEDAEKLNAANVEVEEQRTRISELEADKATLQQECDKLQSDLDSVEENLSEQLAKLQQDHVDGMAQLRDMQVRKQGELQNQLLHLKQHSEMEAQRQIKIQEQLTLKHKVEVAEGLKTQQELQRTLDEHREEKTRLRDQLASTQAQLQENKKIYDITLEKLRDKHQDEVRALRDQSTKELRDFTDKEMTLTSRCSGLEHKLETNEHRLNELQKKYAAEVSARANDKPLLLEYPRLKEKLIRLDTQLKAATDANSNHKQLLRQAQDRVAFLERQMKERERKSELANHSAQLMLARQRFMSEEHGLSGNSSSSSSNNNGGGGNNGAPSSPNSSSTSSLFSSSSFDSPDLLHTD